MRSVAQLYLILALVVPVLAAEPGTSKWVFYGPDHRLHYGTDSQGNRIMDFSYAGYKGGGVAIPDVRAVKTLSPVEGDDTAQIQTAIDEVAKMPLDVDGFRGAVLLGPGTFEVGGGLTIASGGIVLRGSGSGDGGTTLRMTGRPHRLLNIRGSGSWQIHGEPVSIIDAYIPCGERSFTVKSADAPKFKAGDTVLLQRPVTEAWVKFMEMDKLERGGQKQTWIRPGSVITFERTVTSVVGYRITLDVPLSDSFDAKYLSPPGTSVVKYTFPGRISNVGFEHLRVAAMPEEGTDRDHGLLGISAVSDAWVRDIDVDQTLNGTSISSTARRITFQQFRLRHRNREPHQGGSSPAHIAISGTQILLDRCSFTGKKSWPVVTQGEVIGPNVVLNLSTDEAGVSPHQRWATGLLVDGGDFRENWEWRPGVALANRAYAGSGHGWSAGWSVCWNVRSEFLLVQQPPGAMNWSIGSTGRYTTVLWDGTPLPTPCLPADAIESVGVPVSPASLYLAQLRDRLGDTAVQNAGYDPSTFRPTSP